MWGTSGYTHPTDTPLLQYMVLTAATHYQQMKNDSSSDATPWAHSAESDSENRPFDQSENEMELLNASDETIPLFPNQLVKLGHRIKEKQLERPESDKTLDERCYASGMASFFGFPGTMWIEWPQGSRKQSLPLKQLMSYMTCQITCDRAITFRKGMESLSTNLF